ncbi:MAG: hypothetical protein IPK82_01185 [Polyangiaceae bacterium]|nr:hypothetical protein [Polyangiaceae bacterium]
MARSQSIGCRTARFARFGWLLSCVHILACDGAAPPSALVDPAPEAGFIELEPLAYKVHGAEYSLDATTSAARLFYLYQPAEVDSENKPLIVLHSGGPGASTAILIGGNTAPLSLDPARTQSFSSNPATWTRFANLLYIDARGTGFSYGIVEGATDPDVVSGEFSVRNFNTFVDAADLIRVVFAFVDARPSLVSKPIWLAGESYGGVRQNVALHMLLNPQAYGANGVLFECEALAERIESHFEQAGTLAKEQFDRAIFLQPRITSPEQQAAAGADLEGPTSPLYKVAEETGVPFVPCADKPPPCHSFANVVAFLEAAGRDIYDFRKPVGDAFAKYKTVGDRIEDPLVFESITATKPGDIADLTPARRLDAYRVKSAGSQNEPFTKVLGALNPHDRYFEVELFDLLGAPFSGAEATGLGIERQNSRYGALFLENALSVKFFITNAAFDAAIWTPALPAALQMYTNIVSSVHIAGSNELVIEYASGAFGNADAVSRSVAFFSYAESGHSVSFDEPDKIANDLAQWAP